jgi:hypothetical protein
MANTCNPSYLGGGDHKDHSSRTAWAKLVRPHFNRKEQSVMVCACHLSYTEA